MEIAEVQDWLKANNRTQTWLAAQLGVTQVTVNRWFNGKMRMSSTKAALLERLMASVPGAHVSVNIPISLPSEIWEAIDKLADSQGITPEAYIRATLTKLANNVASSLIASRTDTPAA